jgi:hypothetical protein
VWSEPGAALVAPDASRTPAFDRSNRHMNKNAKIKKIALTSNKLSDRISLRELTDDSLAIVTGAGSSKESCPLIPK